MKIYYWFLRHLNKIIYLIAGGFSIYCIILFRNRWNCPANNYSDNVTIEVLAGLLLSFIPLLIGLDLGKKVKSDLLHFKFKDLLKKIAEKRISKKFSQITARELVKDIAKNLGSEITELPWYQKIDEKLRLEGSIKRNCGVCGKKVEVEVEYERCAHCHLNCFAWKFDED